MSHTQYQERISLYVDSALSDKESADLFAHLSACEECRTFMKIILSVHSQVSDEELEDVPGSLDRRILASVAQSHTEINQRKWYTPVWVTRISIPLPAAASILFLIIVGSLLVSPMLSQKPQPPVEVPKPFMSEIPPSLRQSLQ